AKIKSIDLSAAEKVPGFKAAHLIAKDGAELYYAGDEILGIAADTEEHLQDALHVAALNVQYEILPHLVQEDDALKNDTKTMAPQGGNRSNVRPAGEGKVGDVETAYKEADAVVEGTYGVPTICHQCLESHGLVAEWDAEGKLTVWASTQAVPGTAGQLAGNF